MYNNKNETVEFMEKMEGIEYPDMNQFNNEIFHDATDVITFIHELENNGLIDDCMEYTGEIVDNEQIDEILRYELEDHGGWQRAFYFLQDADRLAEIHRIDGYGNITSIDNDYLHAIMTDALDEARSNA